MEKPTNWNYDALAKELSESHDCDEAAIPFLLEEARKRRDGGVIAELAGWFDDGNDHRRFLELATEAAELGSPRANFWLGNEYRWGTHLPRDYEKAFACYQRCDDYDWVPIEPEKNTEYEIDGEVEVTADMLLSDSDGDIGWWLFVLEKHPSRSLKCGMADWFMKQGGDENRERALKLLEESANDGLEFAFLKLLEFYSSGDFKDLEKGKYWFYKAEEHGFDEACFADALGVESLECRKLKAAADLGDRKAAAKLACAYLHGGYGDYICCAKDEALARQYGVLASLDEDGMDELIAGLDDNSLQDKKFLSDLSQNDTATEEKTGQSTTHDPTVVVRVACWYHDDIDVNIYREGERFRIDPNADSATFMILEDEDQEESLDDREGELSKDFEYELHDGQLCAIVDGEFVPCEDDCEFENYLRTRDGTQL